jgi:hypothetical protein
MNHEIKRRAALKPIAAMSAAIVLPGWLLACSKKPDCSDVSSLSADDLHTRNDVAKYQDQTLEATKRCSGCAQYVAAAPNQCGGCKIVKGPINPDGVCTLFVAKPS